MSRNTVKYILFLLAVFPSCVLACKCDARITYERLHGAKDIIHIKVESLKLVEVNSGNSVRNGVEVGYQIVERFWGPERTPVLIELLDSCASRFYPNREYIVLIPKLGRFGAENIVSRCSGIERLSTSNKIERILNVKQVVKEYISRNL